MNVKIFQLHKRSVYEYSSIQDKYSFNASQGVFAIADGATQGYKSEIWANLLVDNFVKTPTFIASSLIEDFKRYASNFKQQDLSLKTDNPAFRLAEERKKQQGAYATFMGVSFINNKFIYISSGDVCGFLVRGDEICSFPHKTIDDLENDKGFLGTQPLLEDKVMVGQFKTSEATLEVNDIIILATDAIARLLLKEREQINVLLNLSSYDSFYQYILNLWETKRLEEDDITICIIEPSKQGTVTEFLPPSDFSFPKEDKPNYVQMLNEPTTAVGNINDAKREIDKLRSQLNHSNFQYQKLRQKNRWKVAALSVALLGVVLYSYIQQSLPAPLFINRVDSDDTVMSGTIPKGADAFIYADKKMIAKIENSSGKWVYQMKMSYPAGTEIGIHILNKKESYGFTRVVMATQADTFNLVIPKKIEVKNPADLSNSEKSALKDSLIEKNKTLENTAISIDSVSLNITFPDDSKKAISLEKLINTSKTKEKSFWDTLQFWKE